MEQNSLGMKIFGFCILIAGGLIFAVSLFFGIADLKEGSFGGFIATYALFIFWPIAIGFIIAAIIILKNAGTALSFKKPKVILFLMLVIFLASYLIFYLSFLRPKITANVTQNQFFARALPNTEWVKEKIPLYFVNRDQLGVINTDGSEQKIIFERKGAITGFILSPDGKSILVVVQDPSRRRFKDDLSRSLAIDRTRFLYLVRLGNDKTVLVDEDISDSFGYIQWSPDGQNFFI